MQRQRQCPKGRSLSCNSKSRNSPRRTTRNRPASVGGLFVCTCLRASALSYAIRLIFALTAELMGPHQTLTRNATDAFRDLRAPRSDSLTTPSAMASRTREGTATFEKRRRTPSPEQYQAAGRTCGIVYGRASAPRQQTINMSRNELITGAGLFLQSFAIDDLDLPAGSADELGGLKSGCNDGHGSPAHSQHLAQEFLRERDGRRRSCTVNLNRADSYKSAALSPALRSLTSRRALPCPAS
jgi:hypothetical protein